MSLKALSGGVCGSKNLCTHKVFGRLGIDTKNGHIQSRIHVGFQGAISYKILGLQTPNVRRYGWTPKIENLRGNIDCNYRGDDLAESKGFIQDLLLGAVHSNLTDNGRFALGLANDEPVLLCQLKE